MILKVGLAVALIAQAARTFVHTVGKLETRARVKAWWRKAFIDFNTQIFIGRNILPRELSLFW